MDGGAGHAMRDASDGARDVPADNNSPTPASHTDDSHTDDSLGLLLRGAHRAMVRALSAELAPHQVTNAEWSALRVLWRGDGLTQVALAERLAVEKASLTPIVAALERKKLITRRRDPRDRRKSRILLTAAGRRLRSHLLPLGEMVNTRAEATLTPAERTRLHTLLRKVTATISATDETAPEG